MLDGPSLADLAGKTGLKYFTVAFVLGDTSGCSPSWGGQKPIDDPKIIENIRGLQKIGGQVVVATGGAMGPYLESICKTASDLTEAYLKILDTVKTDHLDIDIEAAVPLDVVTKALKMVQEKRPQVTVRFTLMVQGDDYGLTPELGVKLLEKCKANGLRVDIVNPMTMEYGTSKSDWGEAVIAALESVLGQMKKIWPEKSTPTLYAMLGATPMIGRNFNGKIFNQIHAKQLVNYAESHKIGYLGFWSVGRDNGQCPGGGISPQCSSIKQEDYDFSKIFAKYDEPLGDRNTSIDRPTEPDLEPTETEAPEKSTPKPSSECKGREKRFDEWCVANCAVGYCPPDFCACGQKSDGRSEANKPAKPDSKAGPKVPMEEENDI